MEPEQEEGRWFSDLPLHAVPGHSKLPNNKIACSVDKGIVPKELKHIHHGTVAIKKIYGVSFFWSKSTEVCEKSREFKSSSEMVPKF